jgi:hypothetical protein
MANCQGFFASSLLWRKHVSRISPWSSVCSCEGKSQCKKSCVCAEQNLACTDLCSCQGSESCKNVHSYTLAEDV